MHAPGARQRECANFTKVRAILRDVGSVSRQAARRRNARSGNGKAQRVRVPASCAMMIVALQARMHAYREVASCVGRSVLLARYWRSVEALQAAAAMFLLCCAWRAAVMPKENGAAVRGCAPLRGNSPRRFFRGRWERKAAVARYVSEMKRTFVFFTACVFFRRCCRVGQALPLFKMQPARSPFSAAKRCNFSPAARSQPVSSSSSYNCIVRGAGSDGPASGNQAGRYLESAGLGGHSSRSPRHCRFLPNPGRPFSGPSANVRLARIRSVPSGR